MHVHIYSLPAASNMTRVIRQEDLGCDNTVSAVNLRVKYMLREGNNMHFCDMNCPTDGFYRWTVKQVI